MIKRLEPIQEITKDDLREWKRQALDWESGDALGALNMAIYAIFHGSAGYAIVDDETDELVALCSYVETTTDKFLKGRREPKHLLDDYLPDNRDSMKMIWVTNIVGKGRHAAWTIMKDLMQIALAENKIIGLESLDQATGFYDKLGFVKLDGTKKNSYPIYIYGENI